MADNWLQALLGGGFQAVPPGGLLGNMGGDEEGYRGFMNGLNNNRNMIAGLGLGLLSGTKYNPYGNVMQGFAQGAHLDNEQAKARMAQLTPDIKEFQYAKSTGAIPNDMSFTDYQKQAANLRNTYGNNPQWYSYKGPNGEQLWGLAQTSSGGGINPLQPPNGGQWAPPGRWLDTGTGYQNAPNRYAPGAGQPTTSATDAEGRPVAQEPAAPIINGPPGVIPKDVEGAAAAKKRGTDIGQAQFDLPRVEQNAQTALKVIDQLQSHPGKKYAVGALGIVPGVPGTEQRGFVDLFNQAKGKAFMEAYQTLKGGGQITEIEGTKGTDAIARMDRAQNVRDFDKAMDDFKEVIQMGLDRARRQAKQGGKSSAPANNDPFGLR